MTPDQPLTEADVQRIVDRRLAEAFARLMREATEADVPYETDREDSNIYLLIQQVAERTARAFLDDRRDCPHLMVRVPDPANRYKNLRWECRLCGVDDSGRTPADRAAEAAAQRAEHDERLHQAEQSARLASADPFKEQPCG